MNDPRLTARLEEAARWFAASRRGVMSLAERARFEQWRTDKANAAAMREFDQVWAGLEALRGRLPDAAIAPARKRARVRVSRPALVAALCAASLLIGAVSVSGHSPFWTALDWTDR